MRPEIHWIDLDIAGKLAIMPRPRAGEWLTDEIGGWRAEGLDVVVSLLERDEVEDLGLHDEEELCKSAGMKFISFPIPDRGVPESIEETRTLAKHIAKCLTEGLGVGVHCRAGIGRSSLIIASALVSADMMPDTAFSIIATARGTHVPDTEAQRQWVIDFHKTAQKIQDG